MAGGIAHDFNNLLTVILGNAEQARVADDRAEREDCLDAVQTAATRAAQLVREIRDFSQPRATDRAVVAVSDVIGSVLRLLATTMPKHLTLETSLDPRVTMFAAATQVQQVVTNLVLNAVQALGDQPGRVVVTLDEVLADAVPDQTPRPRAERYARLTVADTGPGIAADVIPRVFDPFFSTRTATGGSGLGLAVVQGIVRRYHGAVAVESTPGHGATFRVYWPALPPEATLSGATRVADGEARAAQGHGRHILVVDDEAAIVQVVRTSLSRLGYRVTATTDPEDALARFTAEPDTFDAVLSDLSMPAMSGAALGRRMLDLRPDLPVVLFTGHAAELGPDEARTAGFRAILHKPMTAAALAEALHRVLPAPAGA
jgi:CheY-like chemotaxis protein